MKREQAFWLIVLVVAGAYLAYRGLALGVGTVYVQQIDGAEATATGWEGLAGTAQVSVARTMGVWVAAIFTLCILSFLYKDNPFYKTAEAVVVGVSAAYWMVTGLWDVLIPNLIGKLFPAWVKSWAMPGVSPIREDFWYLYFFLLLLGVMLVMRLSPKGAWIARWPLAFIIGATAGVRMMGFIWADFISQISNTIRPLAAFEGEQFSLGETLQNITLVVGVLACLVYFFFSIEHKGVVGKVAKVGIWFLMVTFGAAFGYTVMGRIALLAMRLEFLFDDWLWLIDPRNLRPLELLGWC